MAEHFVRAPYWEWYILGYFFLAGLAGGTYALSAMLRLWGDAYDRAAARRGFLAAFVLLVPCPVLLTVDLGQPLRFWHMLIDTTPGRAGFAFKDWSPMSLGSWVLAVFGVFAFVSFLDALGAGRRDAAGRGTAEARPLGAMRGVVAFVGTLLGLFFASYTGVLLSVSNQPIWSDTWALGGLFLASGLSGSAALLAWLSGRSEPDVTGTRLVRAERFFAFLELVLIAVFFMNIIQAGTATRALSGPWSVLWVLIVVSLLPPLMGLGTPGAYVVASGSGSAAVARVAGVSRAAIFASTLIGILLLRFVVIFSAQF